MLNLSNRNAIILGIIVVVTIMLPYIILGEDAFITIHDFLDSNPVHVKTILSLGLIGDPDGMLPVLNGVPSLSYISLLPIDIKTILYIALPLYWAIVCNIFFVRLIAFVGMYVLCYNYIIKRNALYSLLVSILFCLIPFYADYGLSSAGVPLFFYCILNLEHKKKLWMSYVLIIFFACNSSLVLVGVFICLLWGGWIVYKWLVERKIPKYHIIGIMFLVLVYLFVNVSIIYNYFFPSDIISHRVEFVNSESLSDLLIGVYSCYVYSQYHAGSLWAVPILLVTFIIYVRYGKLDKQVRYYSAAFFLVAVLIMIGSIARLLPFVITKSFQFDRFYFLYPSVCFIILAKAFSLIPRKQLIVTVLSGVIAMGNYVNDGDFNKELSINYKKLLGRNNATVPSFKQFFDEQLFSIIIKDLNIEQNFRCKVVSIGMYPSVTEYNNFFTLDSYVFNYSIDYKHRFRKVIKGELEKSETLRKYFDEWGSRCYIFSSDLGLKFLFSKTDNVSLSNLELNISELRNLGCDYIFSAVEIKNYKDLKLSYMNSYTTDQSYYNIRVYKLN